MASITVTVQSEWSERETDLETGNAEVCESVSIRRLISNGASLTRGILQRFAETAARRILLCHHLTVGEPVVKNIGDDWSVTYILPGYTHEQAQQCMRPISNVMNSSLP